MEHTLLHKEVRAAITGQVVPRAEVLVQAEVQDQVEVVRQVQVEDKNSKENNV